VCKRGRAVLILAGVQEDGVGPKPEGCQDSDPTVGGAKPRTPLLTSQNRELVPQEHEFHVLGELGSTAADEQPQNCGKRKVGEREEHRGILSRTR
jgi:hypothetical protein